jgi:hypothetical protein
MIAYYLHLYQACSAAQLRVHEVIAILEGCEGDSQALGSDSLMALVICLRYGLAKEFNTDADDLRVRTTAKKYATQLLSHCYPMSHHSYNDVIDKEDTERAWMTAILIPNGFAVLQDEPAYLATPVHGLQLSL